MNKKGEGGIACEKSISKPNYTDNGDGTVTDNVTGLMWLQDMGGKMTWDEALSYAENFELAGYTDRRLPNAKELQSIVPEFTPNTATETVIARLAEFTS